MVGQAKEAKQRVDVGSAKESKMKPYEIYEQVLLNFDRMWNDPRFTQQAKVDMAQEWVRALPPISLVNPASTTYRAVSEAIKQTVEEAVKNEKTQSLYQLKEQEAESNTADQGSMDGKEHAHAPNKTDESGGRRKVAKTPRASTKRGRKKSSA